MEVQEPENWTLTYQRREGTPIWAVGEESSGVMRKLKWVITQNVVIITITANLDDVKYNGVKGLQ
jgi:hypothetical protein